MSGGRYGPTKCLERRCLQIELWPQDERSAWQDACLPGSILEDATSAIAHLAPISQRKTAKGYGRWLSHLTFNDPQALALPAPARLTRPRIKAFVRRLQELGNSSATILCRLQELGDAAKVLAPDLDLAFIHRVAAQIRYGHVPAREKHNRVMGDELADLAYNLMRTADGLEGLGAAVRYRDGLILLLLAHLPLRRKNFTRLSIGSSLVPRQGQWFVTLTPSETKTHAHFEALLHPNLVPWLETYLAVHRPVLATCDGRWHRSVGDFLWISSHGSPMTEMGLYARVSRLTFDAFGEVISPHRFRDMLASTLASHAPEHVRSAASLLGHASLRTTEKYYRIARAQEGHRRYVATLEKRRRDLRG